jgi:hypothetical protein
MWEPAGFPFEDHGDGPDSQVASMPFIHKHVAVMPDAHAGKGSTVGTVIATKGAVIPAAVGVDIGCGMMAVRLSIKSDVLPDNLFPARDAIEQAVPHGRSPKEDIFKGIDVGSWEDDNVPRGPQPLGRDRAWLRSDRSRKHPKIAPRPRCGYLQLGTLGTGNHFIEITEDRGRLRLGDAALRLAGHRQRDRRLLHREGSGGDAPLPHDALSCRTRTSPIWSSIRRSTTTTWRPWAGRRTSRSRTARR